MALDSTLLIGNSLEECEQLTTVVELVRASHNYVLDDMFSFGLEGNKTPRHFSPHTMLITVPHLDYAREYLAQMADDHGDCDDAAFTNDLAVASEILKELTEGALLPGLVFSGKIYYQVS